MAKTGITLTLPTNVIGEDCSLHFLDHVDGPEIEVETDDGDVYSVKLTPEKTAELALWFRKWITQSAGK